MCRLDRVAVVEVGVAELAGLVLLRVEVVERTLDAGDELFLLSLAWDVAQAWASSR